MKNIRLLKILISILILLYSLGLIGLVIILPLKKCIISPVKICIVDWNLFYWFIAIISLCGFLLFLKSLFHLRKIAELLAHKFTSIAINQHLKKCGIGFMISGSIYAVIVVLLWLYETIKTQNIEIGYNFDLVPSLFVIIIGVFFMIQSEYKVTKA